MNASALIFVGLAVAWAAYLIPKALEHHDAGARTRSVDRFSDKLRVLARREPVDRRTTELVTNRKPSSAAAAAASAPAAPASAPASGTSGTSTAVPVGGAAGAAADATAEGPQGLGPAADPDETGFFAAQTFVRRSAASRAARRRRRVLGVVLLLLAMTAAVAAGQVISWWWVAAPVILLAGWLVACRLMVQQERAARRPVRRTADPVLPETPAVEDPVLRDDDTAEVPVVHAEVAEPIASGDGWELVPVTLPTYVSKPAAPRRTVSTIDLDSTGVWTSGRTAADSALAQQADAVRAAGAEAAPQPRRRASGA